MFSCPIVGVVLYLGCFIDCDGIAFHYPLNSRFTINDVFVCFEW